MTELLSIDNVSVHFPSKSGMFRKPNVLQALKDVSLKVNRGETLAIVGESGSGKSTLGFAVAGLRPPNKGTTSSRSSWAAAGRSGATTRA